MTLGQDAYEASDLGSFLSCRARLDYSKPLRWNGNEFVQTVMDDVGSFVPSWYNTRSILTAPSSSGLGHQVLILKIAGSNPAGVTCKCLKFAVDGLE